MRQKFVVRLVAEDHQQMLAWAEVWAVARPQNGRSACPFFAPEPTLFHIIQSGTVHRILVHWCDLDLVRATPTLEPVDVIAGQVMKFDWIEPVWLVGGMKGFDVLPPITLGQRDLKIVCPPTGNLGVLTGASL